MLLARSTGDLSGVNALAIMLGQRLVSTGIAGCSSDRFDAWRKIVAAFTGGDPIRIHHLDRDPEFLIELPRQVQVLSLRTSHGDIGPRG